MKKTILMISSLISIQSFANFKKIECIVVTNDNETEKTNTNYNESSNNAEETLDLVNIIKNQTGEDSSVKCISIENIKKGTQDGEFGK